MTDLERFFRHIVQRLAAADPARLRVPVALGEIRNSIVPYRLYRRALQLESSEDYELVLMRLCAGEGGFMRTDPDEVSAEFAAEVRSPNPDLTLVQRYEKAVVNLDPRAVAKALDSTPDLAFAPQDSAAHANGAQYAVAPPPPKPALREPHRAPPEAGEAQEQALQCTRCGGGLPVGRIVNFCPQCGQNLKRTRCLECQTELEPVWRHCVNCGAAVRRSGP